MIMIVRCSITLILLEIAKILYSAQPKLLITQYQLKRYKKVKHKLLLTKF